jgi:hypothetical protein
LTDFLVINVQSIARILNSFVILILLACRLFIIKSSSFLLIFSGAEVTGSHPTQKSENCSRNLRRVQNRKRIMRSGTTNTNGNEKRKHCRGRNNNIDERKPPHMINRNIYDDYAMKPGLSKPFYIRAVELPGQMNSDGRKLEKTTDYIRPP